MELNSGSSDGGLDHPGWASVQSPGPLPEEDRAVEAERGVTVGAKLRKGDGKML